MRKPNAEYRSREHLTEREVERLIEAVKDNRQSHRDATMVLIAFRHGLRASELIDLRWDQVDLDNALLHVRRLENGSPAPHPLTGRGITRSSAATTRAVQITVRLHSRNAARRFPSAAFRRWSSALVRLLASI